MKDIYLHDTFWQDLIIWFGVILCILGLVYVAIKILFKIQAQQTLESHRRSALAWSEMNILAYKKKALWIEYELGRITLDEYMKISEPTRRAYDEAEAEWIRAAHPERDIKEKR